MPQEQKIQIIDFIYFGPDSGDSLLSHSSAACFRFSQNIIHRFSVIFTTTDTKTRAALCFKGQAQCPARLLAYTERGRGVSLTLPRKAIACVLPALAA